jgi:hypothetical protein
MFLSNWLVFKIVLAAVTGLVDYPLAADVLLVYDNANKLYLSGGSLEYVSNVVLYKGETSYDMSVSSTDFLNSKTLFNNNAGEKMATDGWFNRRIWSNGDGTRFVVLAQEYGSYGRAYVYEHSGGSWTQVKVYDKPDQSGNRMGLYCIMNRAGNRIWVDANPLLYFWERGSSEWNNTYTQSFNNNNNANRGLGMNEAGTILASCDAFYNSYYGQTIIRYVNSSGNWASTTLNGSTQHHWGWESVLNKEGDILFQGSINNGVKIWHRTDAYGASWSHVHTPASDNSFVSNCKSIAISDTGYSFVSGNSDYDSSRGRIYFYSYDGVSNPVQLTFINGENQSDQFGLGMSMSGDGTVAAVTAHKYPSGANDGRVYVYVKSDGSWSLSQTLDKIQSGEKFGSGVALSNDGKTLFVGASENDSGGTNAGCVYVFKKDISGFFNYYITQPGTYRADLQICGIDYKTNEVEVTGSVTPVKSFPTTAQKLYPSDGGTVSDSDSYGYVGLSGNGLVMVVVGKGDDDTTADSGGFIVYEKINGVWTFTQQITNVGSGSDTFGLSEEGKAVQLDYTGTRVFIGAHADDHITTNTGSVYIYKRVAQGNWTLEQRIDGGAASYRYGYNDVNNDGDKLMIGSYGYPGSGNVGRVWYYTRSGTSWSLQDQLAAPSTSAYGNSVGINSTGTRAIIGGYTHSSNTGRVDIWNYSGSSWSIGAGFTGENASDNFGWNVDMSNDGNTVVVGAPLYSAGGTEGRVYIYTTSDGTNWSLLKTLSNQDANEWFGFSVQISGDGNTVVIGAGKNDEGLTNRGKSYVYVKSGGSWPSTPTYTILGTTANANNGYTLGISDTGETIISGAPFDDDKGSNQGAVYIFDRVRHRHTHERHNHRKTR